MPQRIVVTLPNGIEHVHTSDHSPSICSIRQEFWQTVADALGLLGHKLVSVSFNDLTYDEGLPEHTFCRRGEVSIQRGILLRGAKNVLSYLPEDNPGGHATLPIRIENDYR